MAVALMQNKKLIPDFDEASMKQMDEIKKPESLPIQNQRDLRGLLWFSIDNDDSRDLDQITYAENLPDGYKIFVGIADVSWFLDLFFFLLIF
jgi:exoribonuclease-2